jgi:hypothetical protein
LDGAKKGAQMISKLTYRKEIKMNKCEMSYNVTFKVERDKKNPHIVASLQKK